MGNLILVVDDEQDLVTTLEYNLEREGYATRTAFNGEEALQQAKSTPLPDLILLDVMLPDISGTEVCRQIRADKNTQHIPIVMLTAKGEEIDRVVGFELGADDYVVKPFSVRELMLRVRSLLRRSRTEHQEANKQLIYGDLRMDISGHQAWLENKELTLTAIEYKLLVVLVDRKGRVQSRQQLLNDVWGIQADVTTRTVDTHVKRLRQKLGQMGNAIETLRGVGYRFRSNPDKQAS